jgi:hypothetical protein
MFLPACPVLQTLAITITVVTKSSAAATRELHAALRTAAPPRRGIKARESWKSSVDLFTISWSCSAFCHRLDLLIIAKVDADVKSSSLLPSTSSTALLVVFALWRHWWVYLPICFPNSQMSVLMFVYPCSLGTSSSLCRRRRVAFAWSTYLYNSACMEFPLLPSSRPAMHPGPKHVIKSAWYVITLFNRLNTLLMWRIHHPCVVIQHLIFEYIQFQDNRFLVCLWSTLLDYIIYNLV